MKASSWAVEGIFIFLPFMKMTMTDFTSQFFICFLLHFTSYADTFNRSISHLVFFILPLAEGTERFVTHEMVATDGAVTAVKVKLFVDE